MAEQEYQPPAATTKTPPSSPPSSSSPEEEIKKLKEALAKNQKEADNLKKQMDESLSKLKELEKFAAEANQVTTAFASAMQGIATERLEIQDFLSNGLPKIEKHEEVKNRKAEIEAKVKEVDAAIEAKSSEHQILEQKAKEEKTAQKAASDEHAARKQELEALKGRHRLIQEKVGRMRKVRQRMDKDGANNPLVKYVLALELRRLWDETKDLFMANEELEKAYKAKAEELRTATAAAAAQDEKYKAVENQLETIRKDLESRRNSRLDDIVTGVGKLTAQVPAGAGASTSAAGATATARSA